MLGCYVSVGALATRFLAIRWNNNGPDRSTHVQRGTGCVPTVSPGGPQYACRGEGCFTFWSCATLPLPHPRSPFHFPASSRWFRVSRPAKFPFRPPASELVGEELAHVQGRWARRRRVRCAARRWARRQRASRAARQWTRRRRTSRLVGLVEIASRARTGASRVQGRGHRSSPESPVRGKA
jgi:hypothetical protein